MENVERNRAGGQTVVKAKRKIVLLEKLSFVWTVVSVLYSTGFTLFAIFTKWGKSEYTYVLIGIICLYIVVFAVILAIRAALNKKRTAAALSDTEITAESAEKLKAKSRKRTQKMLKDYKSGMAVLKGLANILYIVMTIVLMCNAASMSGVSAIAAWLTALGSLALAVVTLSFKIATIVLKKMLPAIAKKGTYAVYEVIDGKLSEKKKTNKLLQKFSDKYRKED